MNNLTIGQRVSYHGYEGIVTSLDSLVKGMANIQLEEGSLWVGISSLSPVEEPAKLKAWEVMRKREQRKLYRRKLVIELVTLAAIAVLAYVATNYVLRVW